MPVDYTENSRQLVTFAELLDCRFDHPQMSMVVDKNNLAVTVIPKSQHGVNQSLFHHFLRHNHRSRHTDMMVGMPSIIQRCKSQIHFMALLLRIAAHPLNDLGTHECIQAGVIVKAVILGAPDGNKYNVVLAALLNLLCTGGILNIGACHPQFRRGRHSVLFQHSVKLFLRHVPDFFLHFPHFVVLEQNSRVFCCNPFLA